MEAFVITLREGVEAALVVGLILAYLSRTARAGLRRYVYVGLVAAVLASVAGAVAVRRIGLDPESELLEGVLLAVAAVLVATLVLWMWRASRHVQKQVEGRLDTLTGESSRRQGWSLAGLTFFMVFREGVETVLLLTALSLTSVSGLANLTGAVVGLTLAVMLGVAFVRGSVRINLRLFFGVTSLVLMILAVRLLAGSVHEFSEAGVLPSTFSGISVVDFVVQPTTSTVILLILIVVPGLAMLASPRPKAHEGRVPTLEAEP
jgi:FTR1 family protein